jgi:hypothetical protein
VILVKEKETREEEVRADTMVFDLNDDKSPKMTEAMVDLIDFYLNEIADQDLLERISTRKKSELIPLLKRKLLEKPLSSETAASDRNETIGELLRLIALDLRYISDPDNLSLTEVRRAGLFGIQTALEKYYYLQGHYPEDLSQALPSLTQKADGLYMWYSKDDYEERIEYKGFPSTYFLCAVGKDGILGTADDVQPPYLPEVFSFPSGYRKK